MYPENPLSRRQFLRKSVEVGAGMAAASLYVPSGETPLAYAAGILTPYQEPPTLPEDKPKKVILGANMFDGPFSPKPEADLDDLKKKGISLVRVIVANKDYSDDKAARQFSRYLTAAGERGIEVGGIFINRWIDQGHYPQKLNVSSYSQGMNHTAELGLPFYASINYSDNPFINFVTEMVSGNSGRPNLHWVIGNELRELPKYIVPFYEEVTRLVKRLDPKTRIASGFVSTENTYLTPAFYNQFRDLDVSFNDHNNSKKEEGLKDVLWAIANKRRVDMGELGFNYLPDKNRVPKFKEAIDFWTNNGVESICLWGFVPPHKRPDKDLGISKKDEDYNGIVKLTQSHNPRN